MASALLLALAVSFAVPARAETDTHRQDGVTLRLVLLPPDAQGQVRGALSVALDAGWKTYWIAPGPVGLAPRLDFSASTGISNAAPKYPVPIRFAEGEAQSVGYDEPVAFAIRGEATDSMPTLRVEALLGVCRELCVPVQLSLAASPTRSLSDRALVARAEAAAPASTGALAVRSARWNDDASALLLDAPSVAGNAKIDVFAAAGDGWSFGAPRAQAAEGAAVLALPVASRPSAAAELGSVDLLLTAGEIAQLSPAVPITPR